MHWFAAAAWASLLGFLLFDLFRSVRTGRARLGGALYARSEAPAEYRAALLLEAAAILIIAWALFEMLQGRGLDALFPMNAALEALAAAALAFFLIRFLRTGEATVETLAFGRLSFDRSEEPREYWLLVAVTALASAALAWLATEIFMH